MGDISLKNTDVKLPKGLEEKSGDHQTYKDSSSGNNE